MADTHADNSDKDIPTIQVEDETGHRKESNGKGSNKEGGHKDGKKNWPFKKKADKVEDSVHNAEDKISKSETGVRITNIVHIIVTLLMIVLSLGLLILSVLGAVNAKNLDPDTNRAAALIIIAVFAAIAFALAIYSMIPGLRNARKPLFGIGIASLILAILLSTVTGTTLQVSSEQDMQLTRSLVDSFKLAIDHNPRHVKQWNRYQTQLKCCGVYGPDDYRHGLPPYLPSDVPASCCPSYDSDKSDLEQESARLQCKLQRKYHTLGCKNQVVEELTDTARDIRGMSITVIVLLVLLGSLSVVLSKMLKSTPSDNKDANKSQEDEKVVDEKNEGHKISDDKENDKKEREKGHDKKEPEIV